MLPALLGLAAFSQAQSFQDIEQRTLQLFEQAEWPVLIEEGEAALSAGFDYLGLRYRLGVAYYEQQKYFKSAVHLEAALQYDHYHRYTLNYLYYCYMFSGREKMARDLAANFPPDLQQKTGVLKNRFLDFFYFEKGVKNSNYPDSVGRLPFQTVGLQHRLGYRFDFYHAVSYLEQSLFKTDFRQWEYYARADWQLSSKVTLHPAIHYIDLSGELSGMPGIAANDSFEQMVWAGYLGLTITQHRWRIQPYWARIRSSTEVRYATEEPVSIFSYDTPASQYGLQLTYTPPLWKDRLWLYGLAAAHNLEGARHAIWGTGLSAYFSRRLAVHLSYFSGDGAIQFVEAQAAILNNSIDPIEGRWSANLEFRFGSNSSLFLGYQQEEKSSVNGPYTYNNLFFGLKLGL